MMEQLSGVIAEMVHRVGNDLSERLFVVLRRFPDNDLLILGPYESFIDAANAARPNDIVKPLFREEDLDI
jgi:hypothetical protein